MSATTELEAAHVRNLASTIRRMKATSKDITERLPKVIASTVEAEELVVKLQACLDDAKSGYFTAVTPVIDKRHERIYDKLASLDRTKGGLDEGKAWDADLGPKANWQKFSAMAKATLRKSSIAAELGASIEDTKKTYIAYKSLCDTLEHSVDSAITDKWNLVSKAAVLTYTIGQAMYIIDTISDKKQKREQLNQELTMLEKYDLDENEVLPKCLVAQISKVRAFA
jgi:hypothetical protein